MNKTSLKKEWGNAALRYSTPHIRKEYIRRPAILKILGKIKNKKIIDLGCGDGYYSRILAKKGAKVIGVDFSYQSIKLAKFQEEKENLGIDYYKSDISKLNFLKNSSFDIALAEMVLVTIPTQNKYIKVVKETYKILKKGES